ncbi:MULTISPECIES: alcohol dehydrogenase catalytic domain-containing protein [Pasteurellaceae]|uniref:Alcohol dehydrogenase catalytic domain-containing protein n=1 Tax=Pasteurella atlantica TaxID=2827233 RepID=A0AAW8CN67_9PAST|nr:alcohol dehydrogenase catalytic domain-containing protein [Pasteurella atlantica]MBR0573093.1 alcohol dehydrogenase catalytic domain-containing protein [Pasteurella atlantica]MDP8039050.1 alcohol dehydrogenase catalytic domain-containing protein [Pasteurella atlantica]MDP8041140.1 alcohol dehydrogenase catalytic domain-containing protein [Pasteurella atlantica]MDP8043247.1 alcohol dehydrogenase catalytic domain-containing protein [Pasteurella atlantica]MDP8045333.1 alcohol dehydrogenase cat
MINAICLAEPGKIEIKKVDYPIKKENEALIKIESMGICGSDVGAYRGTNPLVTYPRILGHELVGTVIEEGEGIPNTISRGDRVIVEPYIYCNACYPCSIGRTNCCENLKVLGVHIDGGMQEFFAHPAKMLTKVPDNLTLDKLPLAEPLTIALHALHRTELKSGEYVTIIGAGAIGLMAALVAKEYGAIPILIDILDKRLEYAKSIGIPYIINPSKENDIECIKKITNSRLSEVVIEASGANVSIQNTLKYASFAGRIALTGWPKTETLLPTNIITFKELNIYGSRTSKGEFLEALNLLSTGKVRAQDIISRTIQFNEIPEYLEILSDTPERFLKVNAVI